MAKVSASDWMKGISLSILASIIGGASKLAIRKSWLMEAPQEEGGVARISENLASGADYQHMDGEGESNDGAATRNNTRTSDSDSEEEEEGETSRRIDCLRGRHSLTPSPVNNADQEERIFVDESDADDNENDSSAAKKRKWVTLTLRGTGMIGMTFLNPACCVLAMNYASPSILAPFSGLTLVWIVLLSQPIIGEQPSLKQVFSASLILLGEIIVALFGDHTNDEGVTLQDVKKSYLHPPFLAYLVGLLLWMLLLCYWMRASGTTSHHETLRRFAWGVSGGSITGLQNFLKDSLTILKASKVDDDAVRSYPWYLPLLLISAACSAFGGLLFLTACMKRYDATYSSAMFVGSFVVSASIMSAVHYATFEHLASLWNWILYPLGLVILMSGVWMLALDKEAKRPRDGPIELEDPLISEVEERCLGGCTHPV